MSQTLTIGADRDEAAKINGKPGSRRGERAARTLGLKHYELLPVAIAMPGSVGESVDWLDVFRRGGVDAVRQGILAAVPFMPTPAELENLAQGERRPAELTKIAANYPLPAMDTLRLEYRHTVTGKVKVYKVAKGDKDRQTDHEEPVMVPIATPFGVLARLRHVDQANSYGLRCVVQDMNGNPRIVDLDRAKLAKMGGMEIREELFAAGLRTENDGEMIAVQCLKAADPEQEIIIVHRPSWHDIAGSPAPVFVTPGGLVIGAPEGLHLELAAAVRMPPGVAQSGTREGWYQAVEAAVTVDDCPHWTLGVLSGFAGPIVALSGLDTCGIHLSGLSTSGKSTGQRLGASAWSVPDIRQPGLFQSARTTDNAIEAQAERANGTIFALDEFAHLSGKVAAKMIYTIAGGAGKNA